MFLMAMSSKQTWYGMAVVGILFFAGPLEAVNLAPGAGADLAGVSGGAGAGTVVLDEIIPFEIRIGRDILLYQGELQNRVVRLTATGNLAFIRRVTGTQASLNGLVSKVATADFAGFSTDVEYSTTSVGTVAPSHADRSADGATISYVFGDGYVGSGQGSRAMHVSVNAFHWIDGGTTTVTLTTGQSVTLATARPIKDDTAPVAAITSPAPLACVCNPVLITGTASDSESFDHYLLEYATTPGGPWTTITSSSAAVTAGNLGSWNVTGLAQGYYFIRLTVWNAVDASSTAITIVYVDQQMDVVDLRSPKEGAIVGGWVCFDGTINDGNGGCVTKYTVDYRPAASGTWIPVDSGQPTYPGPIYNDPLASWNTRAGLADGNYLVRLQGTDACGHTKSVTHAVVVDNSPPVAVVASPDRCQAVEGAVTVRGIATDAHLAAWLLQYTGGDTSGWVTIASGTGAVNNGVLGVWDTTHLRRCAYTLRLVVTDASSLDCNAIAHNQSEYLVSVYIGPFGRFDYDGDLDVDMIDFALFQRCFSGPAILAAPECLN